MVIINIMIFSCMLMAAKLHGQGMCRSHSSLFARSLLSFLSLPSLSPLFSLSPSRSLFSFFVSCFFFQQSVWRGDSIQLWCCSAARKQILHLGEFGLLLIVAVAVAVGLATIILTAKCFSFSSLSLLDGIMFLL